MPDHYSLFSLKRPFISACISRYESVNANCDPCEDWEVEGGYRYFRNKNL